MITNQPNKQKKGGEPVQVFFFYCCCCCFTEVTSVVFRTSIYGNSGTVVSPGYPGYYSNYEDTTIVITLEQAGPLTVTLSMTYDLEPNGSGCFDYFEVNGDGINYCGTVTASSKSIYVTGSTWTVHFVTDGSVTRAAGFLITYSV